MSETVRVRFDHDACFAYVEDEDGKQIGTACELRSHHESWDDAEKAVLAAAIEDAKTKRDYGPPPETRRYLLDDAMLIVDTIEEVPAQ